MAFNANNLALYSTNPLLINTLIPKMWGYYTASDNMATVVASGYFDGFANYNTNVLTQGTFVPGDQIICACSDGNQALVVTSTNPVITTETVLIPGVVTTNDIANLAVTTAKIDNLAVTTAKIDNLAVTTGKIAANAVDGTKLATTLTSTAGITTNFTTASATPGTIRAWVGKASGTNATMTSGNLVGVRGEVDMVGASGGFVYGVQGKVIPTGTLSGSVWAPAVFGQYDLSGATLNAGQIAGVWADMGATGGTFTDVTGARMFAGTNTIASLTLNAMDYRYGKASNLFELAGDAGTYITAAAGTTPSGTNKVISISIDGTQYFILASTAYT